MLSAPRTVPGVLVFVVGLLGLGVGPAQAQRVAAMIDSTASVVHYTGTAPLHSWRGTSRSAQGQFMLRPARQ